MLEIIGALCISVVIGFMIALLSVKLAEHLGWWRGMELAAIIPMGALAVSSGAVMAALIFWLLL